MESIIETLYIDQSRTQAPDDPELEKVKKEYLQMCDLIKAQYGLPFLDRFNDLQDQIDGHYGATEFAAGFRACARLILEALRD